MIINFVKIKPYIYNVLANETIIHKSFAFTNLKLFMVKILMACSTIKTSFLMSW